MNRQLRLLGAMIACGCTVGAASAQPVKVRFTKGLLHGFLVLRTLQGQTIADGETTQVANGTRVTTKLNFRFRDGSSYEETTAFTQRGAFRLVSDRVVQKGPSFKRAMDMTIDASSGKATVRYTDDGKEKVETETMKLGPDLCNGLLPMLLNDIPPTVPKTTLTMVAFTPKPRLVKLVIIPQGEDPVAAGGLVHKATHYTVKVEIGGITGIVAPIVGKQPPDTQIWMLGGAAPGFLRAEGPLESDGPSWRIEMASTPVFKNDPK